LFTNPITISSEKATPEKLRVTLKNTEIFSTEEFDQIVVNNTVLVMEIPAQMSAEDAKTISAAG